MKHGLIQIYTGQGKGKTTAAIGMALRTIAYGLNVGYINFFKNPESKKSGGELAILKQLGIEVVSFAPNHPRFYKGVDKHKIRQECLAALTFIQKIYEENKYAMLILDEILIAVRDEFLTEKEVLGLMDNKPDTMELILTGRGATQAIIQKADLVSEIKKIKHPFDSGISARQGIEY